MAQPTIDEVLAVLQSLLTEVGGPVRSSNPADDVETTDIRMDDIPSQEQPQQSQEKPNQNLSNSTLMRSHETRHWNQILISGQNGFWVIEMGANGPVVQSLKVAREGKPYTLSDAGELTNFEERFKLDREPWPGNIVMTKGKLI